MLMFWKENLTILAVPKTGSTALQSALGPHADLVVRDPPQLKHAPVYRYNRFFRPLFEKQGAPDMETLAIMREPISWLSSWYRYRARPFMNGRRNSTAEVSFDEFVLAYLRDDRPPFANVGSQARFLEPRRNGTRINHLFRYDDYAALVLWLETRLGRAIDLRQENVSPIMDTALSPQVESRARDVMKEEFALYAAIPDGGSHKVN